MATPQRLIPEPLKRTDAFRAIHQRGRWARGRVVSMGALPNREAAVRVGLRTKRGLKGAVRRNRLRRQARAIVWSGALRFRAGVDVLIVLHPPAGRTENATLKTELQSLCARLSLAP